MEICIERLEGERTLKFAEGCETRRNFGNSYIKGQ